MIPRSPGLNFSKRDYPVGMKLAQHFQNIKMKELIPN